MAVSGKQKDGEGFLQNIPNSKLLTFQNHPETFRLSGEGLVRKVLPMPS